VVVPSAGISQIPSLYPVPRPQAPLTSTEDVTPILSPALIGIGDVGVSVCIPLPPPVTLGLERMNE
jgi:hypothetical protein